MNIVFFPAVLTAILMIGGFHTANANEWVIQETINVYGDKGDSYLRTEYASPVRPMKFPYKNTKAFLFAQCGGDVGITFSTIPNITSRNYNHLGNITYSLRGRLNRNDEMKIFISGEESISGQALFLENSETSVLNKKTSVLDKIVKTRLANQRKVYPVYKHYVKNSAGEWVQKVNTTSCSKVFNETSLKWEIKGENCINSPPQPPQPPQPPHRKETIDIWLKKYHTLELVIPWHREGEVAFKFSLMGFNKKYAELCQ